MTVYRKAWIEGARKLFLAEPYIHHVLEKNDELKNYESVELAPYIRESREDLIADHEFVDRKYHKYIPILAQRLNQIHRTEHSEFFWKKCLALGLLRNITLLYDVFKVCEESFSVEEHDCRVLSKASYLVPKDFNEQRDFFQCTAYGQEQIFSQYVNLFYPDRFESFEDRFSWPLPQRPQIESRTRRFLNKISRITLRKLLDRLVKHLRNLRQPRLAIIESFFTETNLKNLEFRSKGRIRSLPIETDFQYGNEIQWERRVRISAMQEDFDRFDQFFFASLEHSFPMVFVEGFNQVFSSYVAYFEQFSKLRYVVNESWIGNTYSAIAIAILQQRGVKHLYNEHNFLSHHFLCNNHMYLFPLVDEFISLGWYDASVPNMVRGSSLFEWVEEKQYRKEHRLLFVSGQPAVKPPEVNAAYGDFGGLNAQSHLKFNDAFFTGLSDSTLASVVYRGYPIDSLTVAKLEYPMFAYDQEYVLKEHVRKFKLLDNVSPSAKILMQKSELVVVDYLSTSYVESMLADIPTIFFWNQDIYPLYEKYSGFYASLRAVGICQTDPAEAVAFIESIIDNPLDWWQRDSVQEARKNFLGENFGDINILRKYLLTLAR